MTARGNRATATRLVGAASFVAATGLIGCSPAASPPGPAASPVVTRSEPVAAPDPRCEDEPLGVLHGNDASYLVSADELVGRVMRAHQPDFMRCVFRRRHELPDVGGKLVVTLRIDAAGGVSHVLTRGPDPELDQCVCAAVLALTFDAVESATVSYAMYFIAKYGRP